MAQNPYALTMSNDQQSKLSNAHMQRWLQWTIAGAILLASSGLSFALFLARSVYIDAPIYFFLNWNLFLAWLPLFAALVAFLLQGDATRPRLRVIPLLALWLLFFPNAPYILTDLLHLSPHDGVPLWYDLLMLLSYAWNGLILGFVSLWLVQALITRWFGFYAGWFGAASALALAAFGVYLGRFERWNSWDVFTQPHALFNQIIGGILDPAANLHAIAITAVLCGVLCAMYFTLRIFGQSSAMSHLEPPR